MSKNKKFYWKGLEQLTNDPEFVKNASKEFAEELPLGDGEQQGTSRRDFLKLMGFSLAAVSLAACEAPVKKAIPYLNKPEDVEPGIANYYASSYLVAGEYCPVVVKTREGRPIFVEGNSMSGFTLGAINSRVSASVLGLYDNQKAKNPTKGGQDVDWASADKDIMAQLQGASNIRIVTSTLPSPATKKLIGEFKAKFSGTEHVQYDAVSFSGMRKAHARTHGKAMIPSMDFSKAEVIVGIGADFLGNWISEPRASRQYAKGRRISRENPTMSRHYQYEAALTITGGCADYRVPVKPSQEGMVVAALYNLIAQKAGASTISGVSGDFDHLKKCADDLWNNRGKGLVVSGLNDVDVQTVVNGINQLLGNYGGTLDAEKPVYLKQGDDEKMAKFVSDLKGGSVDAVIFHDCNPVYDHPMGGQIASALGKAKLSVSTAEKLDETASACKYNLPSRHYLESWGDVEAAKGVYGLMQPTIRPIYNSRQFQDSLMVWAGMNGTFQDYLANFWRETIFPASGESSFEKFWKTSLHNGVYEGKAAPAPAAEETEESAAAVAATEEVSEGEEAPASTGGIAEAGAGITSRYKAAASADWEVKFISAPIIGAGHMANNPWIQETPDPITKVTWGQYVALPQAQAFELGVRTREGKTSQATVKINGQELTLPVVAQPGLKKGTIVIPLGYGRGAEKCGKVAAEAAGVNVYPMLGTKEGFIDYEVKSGVEVTILDTKEQMAQTQTHQTVMGRQTVIQEAVLATYKDEKAFKAQKYDPKQATSKGLVNPNDISIWDIQGDGYGEKAKPSEHAKDQWKVRHPLKADQHPYPLNHWGMTIDLNTCTGCSACITACSLENNVPVVGKEEVARRREMHWMRIDRYYSSDAPVGDLAGLEKASENPEVVFQPMMCQHCNNAPCETVCPVAATTHSSDGLNQMAYNRCVGTKYCANNCPYKVRRFNWFKYHGNDEFDYHMNNPMGRMVLNPDVTVRSRGVMEKCSMCVQRIQAGKLQAKKEKRPVRDGEVKTACMTACPTEAISFGDLNDTKANVTTTLDKELDDRAYHVLKEINVSPNVWYFTKIRNKDAADRKAPAPVDNAPAEAPVAEEEANS